MINIDEDGSEGFSDYETSYVEQLEPFQLVKYVHNQQVNCKWMKW